MTLRIIERKRPKTCCWGVIKPFLQKHSFIISLSGFKIAPWICILAVSQSAILLHPSLQAVHQMCLTCVTLQLFKQESHQYYIVSFWYMAYRYTELSILHRYTLISFVRVRDSLKNTGSHPRNHVSILLLFRHPYCINTHLLTSYFSLMPPIRVCLAN